MAQAQSYSPESRQLQTARLEHLLAFSDLVILLIGPVGVGKTHTLGQLHPNQPAIKPNWVRLALSETYDVTKLLKSLCEELQLSLEADNRARLTSIHAYAKTLNELGDRLHLLIDDADFLTDNALELLINFSRVDQFAPQIVLSGLPEFEERFYSRNFNTLLDGKLHIELIQPLTGEESRQLVEVFLDEPSAFEKAEMRKIVASSAGRPGLLLDAAQRLGDRAARISNPKKTNTWFWGSAGLVTVLMGGLFAYLWLPFKTDSADQAEEARVLLPLPDPVAAQTADPAVVLEVRSELSERLSEQEARLEAEQVDTSGPQSTESIEASRIQQTDSLVLLSGERRSEEAQSEETQPLETEIQEPVSLTNPENPSEHTRASVTTQNEQPGSVNAETAQPGIPQIELQAEPTDSETQLAEAPGQPSQQSTPDQSSIPLISSGPGGVMAEVERSEPGSQPIQPQQVELETAELEREQPLETEIRSSRPSRAAEIVEVLSWPARDLTIQLLAARERETANRFMQRYENLNGLLLLEYPHRGATRFLVIYRHFPSREQAAQAVSSLPSTLQALNPWIRSVAGLQTELSSS